MSCQRGQTACTSQSVLRSIQVTGYVCWCMPTCVWQHEGVLELVRVLVGPVYANRTVSKNVLTDECVHARKNMCDVVLSQM